MRGFFFRCYGLDLTCSKCYGLDLGTDSGCYDLHLTSTIQVAGISLGLATGGGCYGLDLAKGRCYGFDLGTGSGYYGLDMATGRFYGLDLAQVVGVIFLTWLQVAGVMIFAWLQPSPIAQSVALRT